MENTEPFPGWLSPELNGPNLGVSGSAPKQALAMLPAPPPQTSPFSEPNSLNNRLKYCFYMSQISVIFGS